MIIAIDGTASSGKTSAAKELSKRLDVPLLPTGLIYRAITLKAINENIVPENQSGLSKMLESTTIETVYMNKSVSVYLDKLPVSYELLKSEKVSENVAKYACIPFVREYVRKIQRQQADWHKNIIVEGRDIGSIVFPNADIKFFVDADLETRAIRRQKEFLNAGENMSLEQVKEAIIERDEADRQRAISPLIMTSDAILIDTSNMSVMQVVDLMIEKINQKKKHEI